MSRGSFSQQNNFGAKPHKVVAGSAPKGKGRMEIT